MNVSLLEKAKKRWLHDGDDEKQMDLKIPVEASAAFIVVRLAEKYEFPGEIDKIYSAMLTLLAIWGHSKSVRHLLKFPPNIVFKAILISVNEPELVEYAANVAKSMPFMDIDWQPNMNQKIPMAVASLSHDWQSECGGPWNSHMECVDRAIKYCCDVGVSTAIRYGKYAPQINKMYNLCKTDLDRAQFGAQLADVVSPYSGSTSPTLTKNKCNCYACFVANVIAENDHIATTKLRPNGNVDTANSLVSKHGVLPINDNQRSVGDNPNFRGNSRNRFKDKSRRSNSGKVTSTSMGIVVNRFDDMSSIANSFNSQIDSCSRTTSLLRETCIFRKDDIFPKDKGSVTS